MVEGHILKFLKRQKSPAQTSRKVFPEQKNGYSKQSPNWFKRKFSLQARGGYEYKNDETPIRQRFNYESQKNNFDIREQYSNRTTQNKNKSNGLHNLKKGLLSEYLDKNSWMKEAVPLTGFERDKESRRLNNRDRQKNIDAAQERKSIYIASRTASNFYSSKSSKVNWNESSQGLKFIFQRAETQFANPQNLLIDEGKSFIQRSKERSKSIPSIMGQKQQIRSQRNQMAKNQIHKIQKFKLAQTLLIKSSRAVDSQFVQQRMAMTAREWGGKKSSPYNSLQRFNEMIGWQEKGSKKGSAIKRLSMPELIQDFNQRHEEINLYQPKFEIYKNGD